MALTWPVVLAVLVGAMLHASWNALVKSGGDKALDTALIAVAGAALSLPVAAWIGPPPPSAWPFVAASTLIHIGYYAALAGAYRHGDLGLTYPIMRGFAPLLVALTSGMTRAPVASVAALRETSVLFATAFGTLLLKEGFGVQRAFGTLVIVAGVIALRFA